MRRKLVEKISGFDENLGIPRWFGAGEETDFIMRCLDSGAIIKYVPDVRVHHSVNSVLSNGIGEMVRKTRSRARGTGALYKKHRLSWFVILRGLISLFLKSFLPPYSLRMIVVNLTTIVGRIEGLLCWRDSPDKREHHLELGAGNDARRIQAAERPGTEAQRSARARRGE
jgi:GT2 family glycosyltransferase